MVFDQLHNLDRNSGGIFSDVKVSAMYICSRHFLLVSRLSASYLRRARMQLINDMGIVSEKRL